MPDGVLNRNLAENGSIVQLDGNAVSDGSLLGVVVLSREDFILNTGDLGTESINPGVSSSSVIAMRGSVRNGTERSGTHTRIERSTLRK